MTQERYTLEVSYLEGKSLNFVHTTLPARGKIPVRGGNIPDCAVADKVCLGVVSQTKW